MSKPTFSELMIVIHFLRKHGIEEASLERKFNELSEEEKELVCKQLLSEES